MVGKGALYEIERIECVFQYLYGADRQTGALRSVILETARKEVGGIAVGPEIIESQITHQPGQQAIPARYVYVFFLPVVTQDKVVDCRESQGGKNIAGGNVRIFLGDGFGVSFFQPCGFTDEQVIAFCAVAIVGLIFVENYRSE